MMSSYQQKIKNSMPNRPNAGMKQQSVTIKPAFVPTGRDSYKVEFNGGAMQDFAMFKPKLDSRLGSLHYLTHVGARGAMNPATGMETFTSPRLADLNLTLPIVNDLINQYRAAHLLRITASRDAEINAANAELAAGVINNAARNARVQEANEVARIRQSNLEYDEYDKFLSRAEKVVEDRVKEIREVQERHAKICETIREILGPIPRATLTELGSCHSLYQQSCPPQ